MPDIPPTVDDPVDGQLAAVAAAIGDPARARMLCSLLDGCARTATELAAVADIGASTASSHFSRLREQGLVEQATQGKHRYYRLANPDVAAALEALLVVAGVRATPFKPHTPPELCEARTCYKHMAGAVAVRLHDAFLARGYLHAGTGQYALTAAGEDYLRDLGMDVATVHTTRRSFAHPCLDWSARRPHIGGALGDALLAHFLKRKWVERQGHTRALRLTRSGEKALRFE
ncbi:ArsR/SmtB family transcription factor [Achromobacter aloeverae]|uniref:Transcriptional regulator n=1 Tax=Achromobacter aloeverae TaxID=1750518 RepID=A0A4Q1HGQ6_9BURK|nr:winged helix-turn-helix domain-containing protein [Achromobacter aloeverae]RXN86596.1 transcriptional regulator [Achromobacter aloeverae]